MFNKIPKSTLERLWEHQRKALSFAIEHLSKCDSPCLIRMPTGTGKTGVIGCLTRMSNQGSSLVLTPWAHLRQQMVSDLKMNFWRKIGVSPAPLIIQQMFPQTAKEILKLTEPQIIVSTFATLNQLRLNYADIYKKLANAISLVLVDEGHYEPAVEWGKSVKGLKAKTVLLTATPYRNDLKLFRIAKAHHFTHRQAVSDKIIRKLHFQKLPSSANVDGLSASFARFWKDAKSSNKLPSSNPRAIICCSDHGKIEKVVTKLRQLGIKAIGIHEQFKDSNDPTLMQYVPEAQNVDAEIWVHQHKLTEGLDDHRFCCVALFARIRNDRKLIQQIGRILRRDPSDKDIPALLLAPPEYSAEEEWNAYLEFETELKLLESKHYRAVVDSILKAQPEVEYLEGRFRRRFAPERLDRNPQIVIPPSVLVRAIGRDFLLTQYIEDCTDTLNTQDAVILGPNVNGPCQKSSNFALWVYASFSNSRFLFNRSLYEIKLETHCAVIAGGFLFLTDSKGIFPEEYLNEHTTRVPPNQLTRFLDGTFSPTHVSIDSSIPYDTVIRGADLRGHNLLNIPASLTDRVQICRAARATSKEHGRRYIGMNNSRLRKEVTEEDRRTFEVKKFTSWANGVAQILNSAVNSSPLFERYMPVCAPPIQPVAKTICLDITRMNLNLTLPDGRECRFKSSSADIVKNIMGDHIYYNCRFDLEGDGIDEEFISLKIDYEASKQRFWFRKDEGISIHINVSDKESESKSLAEFLNQRQDIVLIGLDGGEIIYQGRNFYRIDYSHAETVLLGLIKRPVLTANYITEKGTKVQLKNAKSAKAIHFPENSLFHAIANREIDLPFEDPLLICDDLGTECADFIAANFQTHQLAFIHAKTGKGGAISVSDFHEVVAQAMKNLVYLSRSSDEPEGIKSWKRGAKWNKTGINRLYRFDDGLPTCRSLWEKIKTEIIGYSNPQLYVMLVTAGCCKIEELQEAVTNSDKRTPETAQLLHLLDGLNGYARQLGVQVLIRDLSSAD